MPISKSRVQTLQQSDMQVNGQSLDYSYHSSSSLYTPLEPYLFSTIHQNNSSSSSASTYSQTLRSKTSAYKSNVHQTSSSSAPSMDEQDEIDENYEMTLLSEAEILDRDGNFLRTQTMTIKDVYKLNEGEMIVVPFNDLNQPIKSAAGLFTRCMTLLEKEPKLCPLDAKNWKECKKHCGLKLIMELRRRFDFPRSKDVDEVIFSHLNDKFRTLKHRIKKSLLALAAKRLHEANNFDGEMQYTDDEILQALDLVEAPHYFVDHQWESYKDHLRAPKTKQLSAHGKKARGSQVHIHTTGAMSLARKKDAYKVKYKREPDDIEIFEMEHVTKLGSYVDDRSRVLASKAKAGFANKLFKVGISEREDPEKRLEIAREVMQELRPPKKNGRRCGYGVGVTKSQVTKFSFDLRRMRRQGVSSENRFLLNKVVEQSKQIEKQSRKMNTMEENMTRFMGELKTMLPDVFATRTSKTQLFSGSREDRT
ncbi:ribose 5-phosphate isomerase A [Tanacetum coccineum]